MQNAAGPVRAMNHFPQGGVPTQSEGLERVLKRDEPHEDKKTHPNRKSKPRAKKAKTVVSQIGGATSPGSVPPASPAPTMVKHNLPPSQIPPVHTKAVSPLINHGHPYSPVRSFPPFPAQNHPFPGHYRGAVRADSVPGGPRLVIANRPPIPQRMTQMRLISNGTMIPITDNSQIVTQIPVMPSSPQGNPGNPVMSPASIPVEMSHPHSPSPIVIAPQTPPLPHSPKPPPPQQDSGIPTGHPGANPVCSNNAAPVVNATPNSPVSDRLVTTEEELQEIFNGNTPGHPASPLGTTSFVNQQEDRAKQDILKFLLAETPSSNFSFDSGSSLSSPGPPASNSASTIPLSNQSGASTHPLPPSSGNNHSNNNQNGTDSTAQVFKVPLPPKPKNSVS